MILSFGSSFIAIFPEAFIEEKSLRLFFLIFPCVVANNIWKSFNSASSSGNGIIELIDWWFFNGRILNSDFPFDNAEPSGIFQALILYTKPCVEKKRTDVCVFTERVCTTESSPLVLIPDLPLPPLFCCLTLLNAPLLI